MPLQTSHNEYPPFPSTIPTAPLLSIRLADLESGASEAYAAFTSACENLGFFYLDMHDSQLGETIVGEAEQLNALQKQWWALPDADKDVYGRDRVHEFFSYRFKECVERGEDGERLRIGDYNIRKDDILGQTPRLPCHPLILSHNDLLKNYVEHCRVVIDLLFELLNRHLELPPGTLAGLHRITQPSGDHIRFNFAPPQAFDKAIAKRGEHTDFGSLTILFNWLGGLQIRPPGQAEWVYVRPVPGSCIVNLGDAMVAFSAGLLRSNIHRVVPPPGEQAGCVRNSLVFFTRPEDDVVLKRLRGGIIDKQPQSEANGPEMTAREWWLKRASGALPGIFTKDGFEKGSSLGAYSRDPAPDTDKWSNGDKLPSGIKA